ncbi:hypothetical protein D1816_06840 [Aquimarina sp. AD10]|uniref:right-handed parallel beta-helix repeat-containing protein n=1 Tax=Aquimarina sp. AD10 TaxID=1714849 RepID=UPI000E4A27A7|nr:right-handed parallel beta-helix repeat-containing protein [Aquimarina sp. AD10]AXT60080.1 hypothetical protein D1816_06840 [Aquimarina sp. AD10]RKM96222.1 hypothetical protein D7033_16030 [Aquimarina sp. AD10]
MKKVLLGLLLMLTPFLCSSQEEIIVSGGTQVDIQNAINSFNTSNNGYGTISIKGDVLIQQNLDVPSKVTLNFYTGNKLIVSDSTSVNIKGNIIATTNQIFETSELDHKIRIHNQKVYPEWFGECSYQNSTVNYNDDITIQKAINSLIGGGELLLKGNEYLITSPININTPSIKIKGKGTYSAGSTVANDLVATNSSVSSIFNISIYGIIISDINFTKEIKTNKGINAKGKALNFVRSDGTKDIDAAVSNCRFTHFKYCIYAEGANLKVTDNFFGASYIGVFVKEAQFDPENQELPSIDLNSQTRGYIIDRNRFHSMGGYSKDTSLNGSACIKIRHSGYIYKRSENGVIGDLPSFEKFRGIGYYNHISNNYADDCKTFFEGNIDRTKVEGNSIFGSGGTAIKGFGGVYGSISNNLIDGSFTGNPNRLYYFSDANSDEFPSGHGIHIDYAHFTTIHNNQILNKRFHGIYIEHSKNSSIQSNTIMNFNRHRYISSGTQEQDSAVYDGIHILKIQDDNPITNDKYNIQNIISNNIISITHNKVEARYAIYAGDGDDYNFIKNNFIVSERLMGTGGPIKIE